VPLAYNCTREISSQVSAAQSILPKVLGITLALAAGGAVLSYVVINIILQGSLQQLFQSIKKLQIVVHMSLVNVSMPGNASIFFSYLLQIVAFDVIPTDNAYDAVFGFEESQPVSTNFELTGYESVYFIRNMGSMYLL